MIDRDRIAYLQELAISHFNDGNVAAAASAWRQVLEMDPTNVEALKGIALSEQRVGAASGGHEGGDQDVDATVMFTPDQVAQIGQPPAGPFGGFAPGPAPAQGGFDADRTMMVGAGGPAPAAPRAPAAPFDADRTMAFNPAAFPPPAFAPPPSPGGFDADKTQLFGTPPPPAPAGGGFDADKTQLFGTPPPPAPSFGGGPAPGPAPGGFDAERTMLFGQPPPSPAAPAWGAPPAGPRPEEPDAEKTMLFGSSPQPPAGGWGAPPPPAAPAPGGDWLGSLGAGKPQSDSTMMSPPDATPPPRPAALSFDKPAGPAGTKPLEDFVLPTGGLQMSAPPPLAPPPAPASGFSFELPPPPAAKAGGGFALPELPSLGPPPAFTPAPPPPPAPSGPKKASAQFGEVDAGEAEALAVPTIGTSQGDANALKNAEDIKAREDEMRRRYEQEYGRSASPQSSTSPARSSAPAAPKSKVPLYVGIGFIALMALGYVVVTYVLPKDKNEVVIVPEKKDPNAGLSKEEAEQRIFETLAKASDAMRTGDISGADKLIADARDIALKAGIPVPAPLDNAVSELERERAWRAKFDKAQKRFCIEDYATANFLFVELEQAKPGDPKPGEYIERIYYNLGISELQKKEPWEAVFYFENLITRNPSDKEGADLLEFSKKFPVGADLGYQYTHRVDSLMDRSAGCR